MNETLKPYLEKLLSSGAKTVEEAAKFIETQTPELASEIIRWGAISESAAPLIFLILMGACVFIHLFYKGEEPYKNGGPSNDYYPPLFIFNLIAAIGFSFLFIVEMIDVLYPLVAPRLYILEKISSLIK
jgi:hypothetical protein